MKGMRGMGSIGDRPPPPDDFFLDAIAARAGDSVVVTNAEIEEPFGPQIVYCSAGFERMTGWRRQDARGRTPRILQCDGTQRSELDRLRQAMIDWRAFGRDTPVRVALANRTRDGDSIWLDVEMSPVWGPDGTGSYWIAVQRDITRRVTEDAAIRVALADADATRCAKLALLSKVAQDMREPLSAVMGYHDILASAQLGHMNPAQREAVAGIDIAARALLAVLDDVNAFTRLRRGQMAMRLDRVESDEIVGQAITFMAPVAARAGVRVLRAGPAIDRVVCDPVRALQCLIQLIDNAIRFSPRGALVRVTTAHAGERAAFSVTDHGPGMTDDDIRRALLICGQIDADPEAPHAGGVGLGLPIVKDMMALQGGELHMLSEKGVGSTVSLFFKRASP